MAHSPPFDEDDPFVRYFSRFQFPMSRRAPVRGIDPGFILSSDGYILANAHSVQGASSVTVILSDRRKFKAKVIGRDPRSDIALLKIVARAAPGDDRRCDEAQTRPVRRRRRLAAALRELDGDGLGDAAFSPGHRLRCIRPDRCQNHSAQFRRAA